MSCREVNVDGLVGPTHNYAGLSFGNLASSQHRAAVSNPRAAALEGLEKMKMVMALGVTQGVIPPLVRPDIALLRRFGFYGTPQQVLDQAWRFAPNVFTAACSASSMWTANAATVAPSVDTHTRKLIFTPANLLSNFHRSIEAGETTQLLRRMFADETHFQVNEPLPVYAGFADEGAANHMRLGAVSQSGLHVFVYGTPDHLQPVTRRFPPRQTLSASQAVARLNQLPEQQVLYVQQHPDAIDAGAFHNDVVAVSHRHILFCHEQAFVDQTQALTTIKKTMEKIMAGPVLTVLDVKAADIPLDVAIKTYLFNSQWLTSNNGDICMILPAECAENSLVKQYVQEQVLGSGCVQRIMYANVRQSMRNGGGPACLRLRVAMTDAEIAALNGRCLLTPERYHALRAVIEAEYPDQLRIEDLRDWALCESLHAAGVKLRNILDVA